MSQDNSQALRLVTYADLASAWQMSVQTIRRWVSEDQKRGVRIPRVRRRVAQTHRYVILMRITVAEDLLKRHRPDLIV